MLKYNRKVDKAEANSQITVGSLLEGLFLFVDLEKKMCYMLLQSDLSGRLLVYLMNTKW